MIAGLAALGISRRRVDPVTALANRLTQIDPENDTCGSARNSPVTNWSRSRVLSIPLSNDSTALSNGNNPLPPQRATHCAHPAVIRGAVASPKPTPQIDRRRQRSRQHPPRSARNVGVHRCLAGPVTRGIPASADEPELQRAGSCSRVVDDQRSVNPGKLVQLHRSCR